MKWYREGPHGITLTVRVVPRASRSEIVGVQDDALKIRLAAPPVDGAANRELVKLLAKTFAVSRSAVTLISGNNSKNKVVRIENPDQAALAQLSKFE